ncbi:MAG: hypothetical protein QXU98_09335 [Candidatus Parvarchaeota archaeon]
MSLHGPITVLQTQSVSVSSGVNTISINYTSPGSGYLEVMMIAPSYVSAFLVVNSAPIFLQNTMTVIPINEGDTINEIQLLSSGSANVLVSARLLPISVAPNANVSIPTTIPFAVLTTNATITVPSYVNSVLVVAVGAGGAGGGSGVATIQAGNGGDTVVTNGNQTIIAGGGQGGYSGNNSTATYGSGGAGGTGSVSNVPFYQILDGLTGIGASSSGGGAGVAIATGYSTAIYNVLTTAGIFEQFNIFIPSFGANPGLSPSGYGVGGTGYGLNSYGGGGGGSGAVVVGLMTSGTFNITIGQGGVPSTSTEVSYGGSSTQLAAYGMPGVVYLGYVF